MRYSEKVDDDSFSDYFSSDGVGTAESIGHCNKSHMHYLKIYEINNSKSFFLSDTDVVYSLCIVSNKCINEG